MCSEKATSKEHAPPRCIFPEVKYVGLENDQRINLIKVPSCDLHNSQKSGDDEYLLYILALTDRANGFGKVTFHTKVRKSAYRRPKLAKKILSNDIEINGKKASEIDGERIERAIGQIARAIFNYETGLKWIPPVHVNTTIFEVSNEQDGVDLNRKSIISNRWNFVSNVMKLMKDLPWKWDNPKTFKYKILYEDNEFLVLSFMFYENIDFQVISHPSTWDLELGV